MDPTNNDLNFNQDDANFDIDNESDFDQQGIQDQGDPNQTSVDGSPDQDQIDDYYDHMVRNGYKDEQAIAKALYHAKAHIKKIEGENGGLKKWVENAYPYLSIAEKAMMEDRLKEQGSALPQQQPTQGAGQQPPMGNAQNMEPPRPPMDPMVMDLHKRVTQSEVNQTLAKMRSDKENYPYMSPDLEKGMLEILRASNQGFPITESGLQILYQAAVGRNQKQFEQRVRESAIQEAYRNIAEKGVIPEQERIGNTGKVRSEDDAIVQEIVNAGYGKSRF
jgi:hypothetical protein